jgi:hypothetical protein
MLILACSRRKRPDPEALPAIERYDGPAFRVLRRYLREGGAAPATLVLSAALGLIQAEQPVPSYDHRLTAKDVARVKPIVKANLLAFASRQGPFTEAMVCGGGLYAEVLADGIEDVDCVVQWATGPPGRQTARLSDWLRGTAPTLQMGTHSTVMFRGIPLRRAGPELVSFIRERADADPTGASRFEAWYVAVGEHHVAPKWLLSQLSGVPVSRFRTEDALMTLTKLGIEVRRV